MAWKWPDSFIKILPNAKKVALRLLNNNHFHISLINIDNSKKIINLDDKTVIQWNTLTKKEQQELIKDIPLAFASQKTPVIDVEKEQLALDIAKKSENAETDLITYFKEKIPDEDLYILRAAIYIKQRFDEGKEVEPLKNSVAYTHGKRGRNICNLYSAGYFETWIKPLYLALSDSGGFTQEKFIDAYNLVVEQYPFAVFVHRGMSIAEIQREIEKKITESQKYGIEILNIHGIGSDNITNIIEAVKKIKPKYDLPYEIEQKSGLFVVKISLKK